MICPNCESENCNFISQTHTSSGSFADGCCGFILFGPIGILCGLCGKDTTTKEFWICNDCGCKFQQGLERKTLEDTNQNIINESPENESDIDKNYHTEDMTFSENAGKDCPKCGKKLNADGNCNFCGYKE